MMNVASRRCRRLTALAALAVVVAAPMAFAQGAAETYNATATLKAPGQEAKTAPVVISITRWTTDSEREKVVAALKAGGTSAVQKQLAATPDAGFLQVGTVKTPLRFARTLPLGGGAKVVTVATAQPVYYVGAGLPSVNPPDKAGYDVAVVIFQVDAAGKGEIGDFAPAAKVKFDERGAFVVEDYGAEAVRLTGIAKK